MQMFETQSDTADLPRRFYWTLTVVGHTIQNSNYISCFVKLGMLLSEENRYKMFENTVMKKVV